MRDEALTEALAGERRPSDGSGTGYEDCPGGNETLLRVLGLLKGQPLARRRREIEDLTRGEERGAKLGSYLNPSQARRLPDSGNVFKTQPASWLRLDRHPGPEAG